MKWQREGKNFHTMVVDGLKFTALREKRHEDWTLLVRPVGSTDYAQAVGYPCTLESATAQVRRFLANRELA